MCLTPHSSAKRNVVLFYLLKIITKVMIKATAMIVTPTNPQNSRNIICNNTVSIAPPPFSQHKLCM